MGKQPLTSEKKVTVSGTFDIKGTYEYLKSFLEDSKHYDVSEKEYEEKNDSGKRKIISKIEAEKEHSDYLKVTLKFSVNMEGKEVVINDNGKDIKLVNGTATLTVNSYFENDYQNQRDKGALATFLDQIYSKYIGRDEVFKCAGEAAKDVGELIGKFREEMNTYIK